ncbi:unnamed protein product [Miscanthus lutarioriparius]|uniref:Uncharacterized protein n=1 Tax=Miscanthus lutarioriparius TaxID=422564 RepID=A0A811QZ46_9POAL|nr:unnamed protein product [Miscanthus lutarioriparius]
MSRAANLYRLLSDAEAARLLGPLCLGSHAMRALVLGDDARLLALAEKLDALNPSRPSPRASAAAARRRRSWASTTSTQTSSPNVQEHGDITRATVHNWRLRSSPGHGGVGELQPGHARRGGSARAPVMSARASCSLATRGAGASSSPNHGGAGELQPGHARRGGELETWSWQRWRAPAQPRRCGGELASRALFLLLLPPFVARGWARGCTRCCGAGRWPLGQGTRGGALAARAGCGGRMWKNGRKRPDAEERTNGRWKKGGNCLRLACRSRSSHVRRPSADGTEVTATVTEVNGRAQLSATIT